MFYWAVDESGAYRAWMESIWACLVAQYERLSSTRTTGHWPRGLNPRRRSTGLFG